MRISDWSSDVCSSDLNLKPSIMELGGKSANIIFDDADFDQALDGALLGIFSNNGQQCLAGSRILVQSGIADRFTEALVERARRIRSEEHTSELQSLMRISYAVFCLKKKNHNNTTIVTTH